jgi:4-hydroxy-3-polyprenylbenzoate decarboxylase
LWSSLARSSIDSYDARETGNGKGETEGRGPGTCPASRFSFHVATGPAPSPEAQSDTEPERALNRLPVVLAITGASGAPYGVRLLEVLAMHHVPTWLLISGHGWRLLAEECGIEDDRALRKATGGDWASVRVFDDADRGAEPASGSARTAGMVICPCSMGTVAAIAHGTSRSLIERAADVVLKERRALILVPRETPLSLIHLRNLTLVTEAGAVVLPAAPGFYHKPQQVRDLVDFVVQRVVDHLGLEIALVKRWEGKT